MAQNNLFQKEATNKNETQNEKVKLVLHDTTIRSIKELRENFDAEEIMKYHLNGELYLWLSQHYYEEEADAIKKLAPEQPGCLQKICSVLGVSDPSCAGLSEEEAAKWEERKKLVSEYTTDPKILSEIWLVATNQEELAELLNRQEKKIYLFHNSFTIPLRISGVEYLGIGDATLDNPYTKEQYEKAGIKISGFTLPTEENPETAK